MRLATSESGRGDWIVAIITDDEHGNMVARIDEGAATLKNVATFPIRLGVSVPISNPSDFTILDPLERQIKELVETDGLGMLVAVISGMTAPFFRECICYVRPIVDPLSIRETTSPSPTAGYD